MTIETIPEAAQEQQVTTGQRRKRAPKLKVWETRSFSLPIPLWRELERRYPRGFKNSGAHLEVMAAIVNFWLLGSVDQMQVRCEIAETWWETKLYEMSRIFRETHDQAQAEAAVDVDYSQLPIPGRWGRPDDIALLASVLRSMSEDEGRSLAQAMLKAIESRRTGARWRELTQAAKQEKQAMTKTTEHIQQFAN